MSSDYNSGPPDQTRHEIPAIVSRIGKLLRWSPQLPYKSKSAWAKLGRKLLPDAKPFGFVVTKSAVTYGLTVEQAGKMYLAVLEEYDNGHFRFVEKGYEVYSFDQTTYAKQKAGSTPEQIPSISLPLLTDNSSSSSPSPISLPSYDAERKSKTASKSRSHKEIEAVNNGVTKSRGARSVNSGQPRALESREVYFPVSFDWHSHPDLRSHQGAIKYVLHLLHLRRVIYDLAKDEFVELKMAYLKAIIPEAPLVMNLLLEAKVCERDDEFIVGVKSYGYRIKSEDLRNAPRKRIPLEDPRLMKRLAERRKQETKAPVHRWLRDQLYRIALGEIDETFLRQVANLSLLESGRGTLEDKVESYRYALGMINDGYCYATVNDHGRLHTNITNLKRELRSVLRVSGQSLMEIDIKGSQLLFLGLEMAKEGVNCGDFLKRCQEDVYKYVADNAKTTRDEVKKRITQRALFSKNTDPCQHTEVKRAFDRLFPEVAKYVWKAKNVRDGNKLLAQRLQKAESNFMLLTVCERIRQERKTTFITSIHDSLLFRPMDYEYVHRILTEEFTKLGVHPRLEPKRR
jgi:hypothetical protein